MTKSLLIVAPVAFVLLILIGFIWVPYVGPCFAIPLGLVAGVLAAVFDRPKTGIRAAARGSIAGSIVGLIAVLGEAIVIVVGLCGWTLQGMQISNMYGQVYSFRDTATQLAYASVTLLLCSVTLIAVMTGVGALGSLLGYLVVEKKVHRPPERMIGSE
jgi:hypothetical protein